MMGVALKDAHQPLIMIAQQVAGMETVMLVRIARAAQLIVNAIRAKENCAVVEYAVSQNAKLIMTV
jgi:hypothetical protein